MPQIRGIFCILKKTIIYYACIVFFLIFGTHTIMETKNERKNH